MYVFVTDSTSSNFQIFFGRTSQSTVLPEISSVRDGAVTAKRHQQLGPSKVSNPVILNLCSVEPLGLDESHFKQ